MLVVSLSSPGRVSLLSAILIAFSLGCSGLVGRPDATKLAPLCDEATDALTGDAGQSDADTFTLMLSNALTACSGACDAGDAGSCTKLYSHIDTICGVSADTCQSFCATMDSPSLKKAACGYQPH